MNAIKPKEQTKPVVLRIPESLLNLIDAQADQVGVTRTALIIHALKEYLEESSHANETKAK